MKADTHNRNTPWLHLFAVLTAIITFLLLGLGGLVTSHEAGMSVPDWPTSYGYNMFALPIKFWRGGAFFEHTHRLLASAAGLLTTILAVWLWLKEPRRWMKWLGVIAFLLVVAQGVLGGLRVVWKMDDLGIVHGVVGQSYFILLCAMALFTGRFWLNMESVEAVCDRRHQNLRLLVLAATILIFIQLILGATMRGQHAGLAISDFPLAHGNLWPDTSPAAISSYNAARMDVVVGNPITSFQILLQMAHRIVAGLIFIAVAACAWQARKFSIHRRIAIFWLALIVCQIGLGAWTIWSNKAADVATLHLMGGALSLVTGALWCIISFRGSEFSIGVRRNVAAFESAGTSAHSKSAFGGAANH